MFKDQNLENNIFNMLQYEQELEEISLKYLSEVDRNVNSPEVQLLVTKIITYITNKNFIFTKLNSLGNLGIALKSILKNKFLASQELEVFSVFSSYYCLTKHIDNLYFSKHPLLYINRSLLMFDYFELFSQIDIVLKADCISNNFSKEKTMMLLILKDLIPHSNYNDYTKSKCIEIESLIKSQFKTNDLELNLNCANEIHKTLKVKIEEIVTALIHVI
jgi:hypothetical protein